MKKTLSLVFSLLLALGTFAPYSTFAVGVGGFCNSDAECTTNNCVANECASSTAAAGGGAAGGLNTTKVTAITVSIQSFINGALVPLLIAIAFIVFLWGVFKYFIYGAADDEARTKGRSFVMYGIVGLVIIFSLWGIVNIGVSLFGVGTGARPTTLPYPTL